MEILPPRAATRLRQQQRWGGLGPFLIKVEPEEFVEETVDPPVRVPPPVSNFLIGEHSWMLALEIIPFQRTCIVQVDQEEEEGSSYHSCEELLFAILLLVFMTLLWS